MRILFISKDILFPMYAGGKIRTYNILKQLNNECDLDIISLVKKEEKKYIKDMQKICKKFIFLKDKKKNGKIIFYFRVFMNLFSKYPYTMANDYNKQLHKKIKSIVKDYDLLICDFLFPALNCIDIKIPKILFQHNVECMIFKRNFESSNGLKKLIWYLQYIKTRRIEKIITKKFDYVICVSKKDVNIHKKLFKIKHIDFVDLGVDINEYKNKENIKKEENSLVFTGGMDWTPNAEAVKWFNKEIFPKLKKFKFYAVGKSPDESLRKLNSKNFIITGRVPDIKPYLFKGDIYVVPLKSGSGTRIKIFEAMAAKIPIVSTKIGAEGLPVKDGENIILRDTPEEFAKAIIELKNDKELYNKLKNNA